MLHLLSKMLQMSLNICVEVHSLNDFLRIQLKSDSEGVNSPQSISKFKIA